MSESHGCAGRVVRLAMLVLLVWFATPAAAVQPGQWVHTAEADFNPGEFKNAVVTNLGDVKLAANVNLLHKAPEPATVVFDLAQSPDGTVYLSVGPEGQLLRRAEDKLEEVLKLDGEQAFALDVYDGELLLAVSGEPSRLAVLREGKLETLIELPTVRYIWDVRVQDKLIYLATGVEGQLLCVDLSQPAPAADAPAQPEAAQPGLELPQSPAEAADAESQEEEDADEPAWSDPRVTVLLDATQLNLLCLGRDMRGRLYVGTDGEGLVYRVTPAAEADKEAEIFVVYDAPEPEIAAMLVQGDGTVYVGTADAEQARPGRLEEARKVEGGRPEPETPAVAQPGEPQEPEPVEPDLPVAPQPDPMPHTQQPVGAPDETADDEPINVEGSDIPVEQTEESPAETPAEQEASAAESDAAEPQEASPEQLDALRQIIRQRLEQARQEGGEMQMMPSQPRQPRRPPVGATAAARQRPQESPRKPGNAVYRINPDLFVTEVFRESVMILRLVELDGKLLVATGNEGQVFQVDPRAEETTILLDLEPQQVPTMLRLNGEVLLGTANPAELHRLEQGFAKEGTYTSTVLDAAHVSQWGRMHVVGQIDPMLSVKVQTRSGNVQDPEQAPWSPWSEAVMLEHAPSVTPLTPREVAVSSMPARFLQYRLTLTGDGSGTPIVDRVALTYVMPNLKPAIASVQAQYADEAGAAPRPGGAGGAGKGVEEPPRDPKMNITWKAEDPNGDQLTYKIEYRLAGTEVWLPLAEDLTATTYVWQTQRMPDGRYHLRVVASDVSDNPLDKALAATRQSDPVVIDNTPPQFVGEPVAVVQNQRVTVRFSARDAMATLRSVHWTVDGEDEWRSAQPGDQVFDSTSEDFVITIPDLAKGSHVITLRVIDARGNALYRALIVQVQ